MNLNEPEYINTDVLIIGSGGAGLRAAIAGRIYARTTRPKMIIGGQTCLSRIRTMRW